MSSSSSSSISWIVPRDFLEKVDEGKQAGWECDCAVDGSNPPCPVQLVSSLMAEGW
jgi:hypothetical protein